MTRDEALQEAVDALVKARASLDAEMAMEPATDTAMLGLIEQRINLGRAFASLSAALPAMDRPGALTDEVPAELCGHRRGVVRVLEGTDISGDEAWVHSFDASRCDMWPTVDAWHVGAEVECGHRLIARRWWHDWRHVSDGGRKCDRPPARP